MSVVSTNRVLSDGPNEAAKLFQTQSPDEVVFGSSSTLNLENLSRGLENDIQSGDEFIVTGEHEGKLCAVHAFSISLTLFVQQTLALGRN